jgi:ATP-binding cassette subfamily C protein
MFKTIQRSWNLLTPRQKIGLSILSFARIAVNLLDVIGVTLIGITVTVLLGNIDSIPLLSWLPSPFRDSALWLLSLTAAAFITKTILGLLLSKKTALFIAAVEVFNSKRMAASIFSSGLAGVKERSRSEIEWAVLRSSGVAFGSVLIQGMTLQAEGSLAIFILTLMLVADWQATLGIVVYFSFVLALFQWFSSPRFLLAGRDISAGSVSVGQAVTDIINAYREISVSRKIGYFLEILGRARELVAKSAATTSYLSSIPRLIVETALILGALAFLALELLRSVGQPNFATVGILLVGALRIMSALLPLQRSFAELHYIQAQADGAQELLEVALQGENLNHDDFVPQSRPSTKSPDQKGLKIELRDVVFDFKDKGERARTEESPSRRPVIDQISLTVKSGEYNALVGPSGSGKSTLVDLILGLFSPDSGNISINGAPPQVFFQENPGSVGYVPQRPGIVSGTVANNVALGVEAAEIDEVRVWEAIREAELSDFVESLPAGINSDLGPHADSLSGGQKQRLGLARALYSRPRLLVLDEATSALDAQTESSVTESLLKLRGDVTIIVVAHRLSTVQNVDEAFVIVDGAVLAHGPFNALRKEVPLIQQYVELMSFD